MITNSHGIFRRKNPAASLLRMITIYRIRKTSTVGMLRKQDHNGYGNLADPLRDVVKKMDDHSWNGQTRDAWPVTC